MKKAILSFAILLFSTFIFGQITGEWEKLPNAPGGGGYLDIKSNGTIYTGNNYRSFDDGLNWEKHQEVLFNIGYDGTILYFENKTDSLTNAEFVDIRYSTDDGDTWKMRTVSDFTFDQIRALSSGKWIARSKTVIFNGGNWWYEIYLSEDEGLSWEKLGTTQSHKHFSEMDYDIVFLPSKDVLNNNKGTVFNLNTKEQYYADLQVNNIFQTSVLLQFTTASNGDIWFIGEKELAKSADKGKTWKNASIDSLSFSHYLYFVPLSNDTLLAQMIHSSPRDTIEYYFSSDNGDSWQSHQPTSFARLHYERLPDGTILGYDGGILRSTNNGDSWQISDFGINSSRVREIKWFGKDSIFAVGGSRLIKSIDGGQSWELVRQNADTDRFHCSKISNEFENKQLFGAGRKLFLTTDAGNSFTEISPTSWNYKYFESFDYQLYISPEGIFIFATNEGLFLSNDDGNSWQNPTDSMYFTDIKFSANGNWFAQAVNRSQAPNTAYHALYRSKDKGFTWELLSGFGYGYSFDLNEDGDLIFKKGDDVLISKDGGDTFESYGKKISTPLLWVFFLDNAGSLIYSTYGGGSSELFISPGQEQSTYKFPHPSPDLLSEPDKLNYHTVFLSPDNYIYFSSTYDGLFRFNRPTTDFSDLTSTSDLVFLKNNIKTFPNPTQNQFTISLPEKSNTDFNLFIFNNLGQKVFEQRLPKNQIEHRIENFFLPEGVYYFLVKNKEGNIGNGKIAIQKQ